MQPRRAPPEESSTHSAGLVHRGKRTAVFSPLVHTHARVCTSVPLPGNICRCKARILQNANRAKQAASTLCLFNVSCHVHVFSQNDPERWVHHSRWVQKIDHSLLIFFEARAPMTCRCEPRHWMSMVSSGRKSASCSSAVALLIFLVCTVVYADLYKP